MNVLGIETTCDETACAVVKNGKEILSNVIATQTDLHAQYGGVYPELACRKNNLAEQEDLLKNKEEGFYDTTSTTIVTNNNTQWTRKSITNKA